MCQSIDVLLIFEYTFWGGKGIYATHAQACCSVLQCVAGCCRALQCVLVPDSQRRGLWRGNICKHMRKRTYLVVGGHTGWLRLVVSIKS